MSRCLHKEWQPASPPWSARLSWRCNHLTIAVISRYSTVQDPVGCIHRITIVLGLRYNLHTLSHRLLLHYTANACRLGLQQAYGKACTER